MNRARPLASLGGIKPSAATMRSRSSDAAVRVKVTAAIRSGPKARAALAARPVSVSVLPVPGGPYSLRTSVTGRPALAESRGDGPPDPAEMLGTPGHGVDRRVRVGTAEARPALRGLQPGRVVELRQANVGARACVWIPCALPLDHAVQLAGQGRVALVQIGARRGQHRRRGWIVGLLD